MTTTRKLTKQEFLKKLRRAVGESKWELFKYNCVLIFNKRNQQLPLLERLPVTYPIRIIYKECIRYAKENNITIYEASDKLNRVETKKLAEFRKTHDYFGDLIEPQEQ